MGRSQPWSKICRSVRVILTALAVPGFALGVATAAEELSRRDVPVYGQPTSIVWADRVYSNKHDLARWLRSRGASYDVWAARHPAVAEVLESGRAQKLAKRPGTPTRRLAFGSQRSADSRRSTLAISILLASGLGLLGLLVALRVQIPVLALAREIRETPLGRGRRATARLLPARSRYARATLARLATTLVAAARPGWARLDAVARAAVRDFPRTRLRHSRGGLRGPRPQTRAIVFALAECVSASRGAWDAIKQRVPARGGTGDEYEAMYSRTEIRRRAADIAVYVTSVLLACVIGASVALYLN